jgi:hypothetical protein
VALVRVGAVRLERRLDGEFDPMRDSLVHEIDILVAGVNELVVFF